ncbi:MAG: hypothetical protein ACRCZP_17440 [Phycicoccus sp.]
MSATTLADFTARQSAAWAQAVIADQAMTAVYDVWRRFHQATGGDRFARPGELDAIADLATTVYRDVITAPLWAGDVEVTR